MKYHFVDSEYYYYEEWTKLILDDTENLVFGRGFIADLKVGDIPYGVKYITFGAKFCSILPVGLIPNSVENIEFECGFNVKFEIGTIPNSVKNFTIENYSTTFDFGILPEGLIVLYFGNGIDYPIIIGTTPDSLCHLEFKKYLKTPDINFIPKSISTIYLDKELKNPIVIDKLDNDVLILNEHKIYLNKNMSSSIHNNIKIMILFENFNQNFNQNFSLFKNIYSIYFFNNENGVENICTLFHTYQFHEELVKKVFYPVRIQNICEKYHIDFVDWINIIS